MTPYERLNEKLAERKDECCQSNESVEKTKKEYEKQSDRVCEMLQEKHEKELEEFYS